jgi:hypothetical protein
MLIAVLMAFAAIVSSPVPSDFASVLTDCAAHVEPGVFIGCETPEGQYAGLIFIDGTPSLEVGS